MLRLHSQIAEEMCSSSQYHATIAFIIKKYALETLLILDDL